MEQQEVITPATPRSVGIRFGLIGAVIGIIIFLIMQVADMEPDGPMRWINIPITIILLYLAHKYYKDNGDGYMNYSDGVMISLWFGLIGGGISSLFTFFYISVIDSSFLTKIRDKQMEEMQAKGMSDEQIDQAMKFAEMFTSPTALFLFGLIGSIIFSLIIGLILSAITQKRRPLGGLLDS